jgi:hypothetical protein
MKWTFLAATLVLLAAAVVACKEGYLLLDSGPGLAVVAVRSDRYEVVSLVGESLSGVTSGEQYVLAAGSASLPKRGEPVLDIRRGVRRKDLKQHEFTLKSIHPNPLRDYTCIRFSVPGPSGEKGVASVEVYDVRGRQIAKLLREDLTSGSHEVIWDGTDRAGSEVPGGVYFVRVQCGERSATERLVVLR